MDGGAPHATGEGNDIPVVTHSLTNRRSRAHRCHGSIRTRCSSTSEESMGDEEKRLKVKITRLQRDTASLLKLLGGSADDRLRFWEIIKGITTPAVFRLVELQVDAAQAQITMTTKGLTTLQKNANKLSGQ